MVNFKGAAAPLRPSLTQRQRRGTLLAGGIGFGLIALGLDILGPTFTTAVSFVAFLTFAGGIGNSNHEIYSGGLTKLVSDFSVPATIILTIVAAALILGFLLSRRILRSYGISRPSAVTWSGAGISTVLSGIGSNVVYLVWSGILNIFPPTIQTNQDIQLISLASIIVSHVLLAAVIGALSWRWMAHTFRPPLNPLQSHNPESTPISSTEASIV